MLSLLEGLQFVPEAVRDHEVRASLVAWLERALLEGLAVQEDLVARTDRDRVRDGPVVLGQAVLVHVTSCFAADIAVALGLGARVVEVVAAVVVAVVADLGALVVDKRE